MSDKPNRLTRFWQELKRRRVIHVITVYASASFVLIELINNVTEPLNLPQGLSTIAIVVLAIGFPFAVLLSWIFDVSPKGVEKTKPASELPEKEKTGTPNSWRIATYASVVIIIGLISFNIVNRNKISPKLELYGKSIAVLPFINDSPDPENEYFINGTMEAILDKLCKIKNLRVVSRSSVEQYRGILKPIPVIAKEMNVSYILEGSGQKIGNHIRLTVQLIDANDVHLWSSPYTREIEMEETFELQSEIAQLVAEGIDAIITAEEKQLIEKVPSTNISAIELYQRGREEFLRFVSHGDRNSLEKAGKLYHRALENDSTYADVYAGLGDVYTFDGRGDSALILANKALSLNNQLDQAYLTRGVYYYFQGNVDAALENLNKALDLNPNLGPAYVFKANTYITMVHDYMSAIENYEEAIQRNREFERSQIGLLTVYAYLAETYLSAGFLEQAKPYYQKILEFDEDSAGYYRNLSWIEHFNENFKTAAELNLKAYKHDSTKLPILWNYIYTAQLEEAYKWTKKGYEFTPWQLDGIAYTYWTVGEYEKAEDLLNQNIEYSKQTIVGPHIGKTGGAGYFNLASLYVFKGDKDKAYQALVELVDRQKIWPLEWIIWMRHNPMLDSIREEELFQKILKQMEANHQAEHDRIGKWLEETGRL